MRKGQANSLKCCGKKINEHLDKAKLEQAYLNASQWVLKFCIVMSLPLFPTLLSSPVPNLLKFPQQRLKRAVIQGQTIRHIN